MLKLWYLFNCCLNVFYPWSTCTLSWSSWPGAGLLNSRPKCVLAGRLAKSGRKWPKAAESGQKWPKLNRVILKLLNLTNKVYNVTITYNTFIIFILVLQYFPQTPGRLATNTKLFKYSLSDIFIHCTSYTCMCTFNASIHHHLLINQLYCFHIYSYVLISCKMMHISWNI